MLSFMRDERRGSVRGAQGRAPEAASFLPAFYGRARAAARRRWLADDVRQAGVSSRLG